MPSIAGAAVGGVVQAGLTAYLGPIGAGIAGAVVAGGVTRVLTRSSMSRTARVALQENAAGTVDAIPVVYGSRKMSGNRVFIETSDSATRFGEFLQVVYSICEGEISAIPTVYLDDRVSTTLAGVTIEKHLGTDDQAASAALIAALPAKWTSAHQGKGIAYVYAQLQWSPDVFPSGLPLFTFDVDGKKVWDPRAQGSPSTETFSDNPALCILDYLRNSRYGCGVPLSMIDEPSFVVSANYFDELVEVPIGSPSTQKRYTCNGMLLPDAGYFENLSALVSSCRSILVFSGGKWKLIAEKVETPTAFTFNEDNIVGAWSIQKAGKRQRFNRVRARFFNSERQWQEDFAVYDSPTHQADDGGAIFDTEIALPFTSNVYTASQLAQIEERASRAGLSAEFTATIAGMRCEVGDVVPITHSTTGWAAKPFRIHRISLLNNDEVRVTAREYQASVYSLEAVPSVPDSPATNLPNPYGNLTVGLGAPVSGTAELYLAGDGTVFSRIRVPVLATPLLNAFVSHFEVQFSRTGSPTEWQDAPVVVTPASNVFAYPVEDGSAYDVRVRAVTSIGNSGDWSYVFNHTVLGKELPPSDVTGFTGTFEGFSTLLRWTKVTDPDIADYEVRRGSTWATATTIGRTRADFLRIETLGGADTYLLKAFDTTGHESTNAASTVVTPVAPGAPAPTASFDGGDLKLAWSAPTVTSYPLARYEVRHGATYAGGTVVGFVDVTTFRTLANWSGSRTWWVTAIDVAGTASAAGSVEVIVTVPSAPTITPEVIDNNVLLRWTDATQTLPIKHYEVRRGTVFASATVIGTVQARFTVIFESSAGTLTYWLVGVDSAGNYGTERSITVAVSQPPDFILYDQVESTFAGTKTNCWIRPETGKLLACINITETFQQHFESANGGSPSWTTPQDQISAGFPIYIEPSKTTGQYVEEIDFGTTIPSTLIQVSLGSTAIAGSVAVAPTISTRADGSPNPWSDNVGVWQVFATGFRYVKITLDFSSSGGDDLLQIDSLTTRLDVKIKRDSETMTANSGDAGGTTVTFNVAFIDVRSINGTAQGTTPANVVIDFTDVPNPTSFKVLVFDLAGSRITREVRWEASGV